MWKYFKYEEFACEHCGENKMDKDFITQLDKLRDVCGFPFVVTSGYRCPAHNLAVSTTGEDGPHTTGRAVDIRITNGRQRYIILSEAVALFNWTRFGIGKTFIHLDNLTEADGKDELVVWTY